MLLSTLAVRLAEEELISPASSLSWAWRIQNQYSVPLRKSAEAWAENQDIPMYQVEGYSAQTIMNSTGVTLPQALELMYVMECDPSQGLTLLSRCTRR